MVGSENVVQSHRHHVVHQRFMAAQEQVRHGADKPLIARIILSKEVLSYLARLCLWFTCQTSEPIPVG